MKYLQYNKDVLPPLNYRSLKNSQCLCTAWYVSGSLLGTRDTHLKVEKRRKETDKSKRSFSTCISNSNVDMKAVKKHSGKRVVSKGFKISGSIMDRHEVQEMYRCSFGIEIIHRVSMKIFNNR